MPWGIFCCLLLAQFPPRAAPELVSTLQVQPHTSETEYMRIEKYTHKVDKFKMRPYDTVTNYVERFFSEIIANRTIVLMGHHACFVFWRGLVEELRNMVFP